MYPKEEKEGFFGCVKIKEIARVQQERDGRHLSIRGPLLVFDGKHFDD